MEWADSFRKLKVRANADTPDQATEAIKLGAEGIGLCRTEHMFLGDRAPLVQRLILAEEETERSAALDELLPLQRQDFEGIFKAMGGRPTTIRLIDPPLHEFLPSETDLLAEVIRLECNEPESPKLPALQKMLRSVRAMHEANPMLGLRGCRLSFIFPGIVQMQVTAIISAACKVRKEGLGVEPEIMIPLVSTEAEIRIMKELVIRIANEVQKKKNIKIDYKSP